jgi:rhodanese-related sulfurtransferase
VINHTVEVEFDSSQVSIDDMRLALFAPPEGRDRYPLSYANITREQARALIDSGESSFVVDVRDSDEYCGPYGHIPDAVSSPWNNGTFKSEYETLLPTSGHIVLICRSGNRSAEASGWLDYPYTAYALGFSQLHGDTLTVYNVLGGMLSWSDVTPLDEPGPDAYTIDDCIPDSIFSWPIMMPAILNGNSKND